MVVLDTDQLVVICKRCGKPMAPVKARPDHGALIYQLVLPSAWELREGIWTCNAHGTHLRSNPLHFETRHKTAHAAAGIPHPWPIPANEVVEHSFDWTYPKLPATLRCPACTAHNRFEQGDGLTSFA